MLRSDEGLAGTGELQVSSSNSAADRGDDSHTPHSDSTAAALCRICAKRKAQCDGLCGGCRLTAISEARAGRQIPADVVAELRFAFTGNKAEVSANLDRLAARTGISRERLRKSAYRRGFRAIGQRRAWTAAEVAYLEDALGSLSVACIARNLGRSRCSIEHKASELKRSLRRTDGYNITNLCDVFGVSPCRVKRWLGRGLLGKAHGQAGREIRVTEENVLRFTRLHPGEYDLGRVDQVWFKALFFGRV